MGILSDFLLIPSTVSDQQILEDPEEAIDCVEANGIEFLLWADMVRAVTGSTPMFPDPPLMDGTAQVLPFDRTFLKKLADADAEQLERFGERWSQGEWDRVHATLSEELGALLGEIVPLARRALAGEGRLRLRLSM